jgi:hypothetical protein
MLHSQVRTVISLELCALNAGFQHFILRFKKMSLFGGYHWKRGRGERRPGWRQGYFRDNSILYINSLCPWRSSGFRPTGPGANWRAEFLVPSLWAKLLEEIRLRHSSAERRPGIANVKNGVSGRVRSGLCVMELGNFCSREHPLREVISSHFSESFWYGRCWFWVL